MTDTTATPDDTVTPFPMTDEQQGRIAALFAARTVILGEPSLFGGVANDRSTRELIELADYILTGGPDEREQQQAFMEEEQALLKQFERDEQTRRATAFWSGAVRPDLGDAHAPGVHPDLGDEYVGTPYCPAYSAFPGFDDVPGINLVRPHSTDFLRPIYEGIVGSAEWDCGHTPEEHLDMRRDQEEAAN